MVQCSALVHGDVRARVASDPWLHAAHYFHTAWLLLKGRFMQSGDARMDASLGSFCTQPVPTARELYISE